jgi:hypothetical protein
LNGTYQLLAYADDMNLLWHNTDTTNKNTGTLIDASKEVGLEVNVEKTKYMFCLVTRMQVKLGHKYSKQNIRECVSLQIFDNDVKKLQFDSRGN